MIGQVGWKRGRGRGVTLAMVLACSLAGSASSAQAEGGNSIATAPMVVYGQQQFGNTATGQLLKSSCGFGTDAWRSYWLVNTVAGDLLTINWEGTHGTELKLMPVGTTDFTLFQTNPVVTQELSSNGKNQAQYSVPQAGAMPLYFRVCSYSENSAGPYAFMVTAQHALSVSLNPATYIYPNTTITGSAHMADGTPVPDGLAFSLNATWPDNGSAQYTATSSSGNLSFPLALPSTTVKQTVALTLSRSADSQYLAPKSAELKAQVALPKPEVAPAPPRHKPLKCKRGFKKRRVHGKARCVRVKRKHGKRYMRQRLAVVSHHHRRHHRHGHPHQ